MNFHFMFFITPSTCPCASEHEMYKFYKNSLIFMVVVRLSLQFLFTHFSLLIESFYSCRVSLIPIVVLLVAGGTTTPSSTLCHLVFSFTYSEVSGLTVPQWSAIVQLLYGVFVILVVDPKQLKALGIVSACATTISGVTFIVSALIPIFERGSVSPPPRQPEYRPDDDKNIPLDDIEFREEEHVTLETI